VVAKIVAELTIQTATGKVVANTVAEMRIQTAGSVAHISAEQMGLLRAIGVAVEIVVDRSFVGKVMEEQTGRSSAAAAGKESRVIAETLLHAKMNSGARAPVHLHATAETYLSAESRLRATADPQVQGTTIVIPGTSIVTADLSQDRRRDRRRDRLRIVTVEMIGGGQGRGQ